MQFFALVTAALVTATHALEGYEGLFCEGEPNLVAPCDRSCHSFANSSSFKAFNKVDTKLPPRCVKMWTAPGCTGTPYVYTQQVRQCTAVTFPAASFSCGYFADCF